MKQREEDLKDEMQHNRRDMEKRISDLEEDLTNGAAGLGMTVEERKQVTKEK